MDFVKRSTINTSVPVEIIALPESQFNLSNGGNAFVTHARLKVFYMGETGDKRLFTDTFSKQIMDTLPQTPVVGYYDEESEDFKAHNTKQYVYGYVPKHAKINFEEVDGKTWAFTDVVLFTGRKDNIGDVATKIIGMQHSLELDPDTVEYVINRDAEGNFKNIEFKYAQFVGLSVVGDAEQPAFTGSHFFTVDNEQQLVEAYETFTSHIDEYFKENSDDYQGGVEMNRFLELFGEDFLPKLHEYMKETYEERMQEVYTALTAEYPDDYIIPMQFNDETVVYYSYFESKHFRINYTVEDSEEGKTYSFSETSEVKARYLTNEEIDSTFVEEVVENTEKEVTTDEVPAIEEVIVEDFTDEIVKEVITEELPTEEVVVVEEVVEEFTNDDEEITNEKTDDTATLLNSDRAELESFRKAEKEKIINEYQDYFTKEELDAFAETVDNCTKEELETSLSLAAMKKVKAAKILEKENQSSDAITIVRHTLVGTEANGKSDIQSLIDAYKDQN